MIKRNANTTSVFVLASIVTPGPRMTGAGSRCGAPLGGGAPRRGGRRAAWREMARAFSPVAQCKRDRGRSGSNQRMSRLSAATCADVTPTPPRTPPDGHVKTAHVTGPCARPRLVRAMNLPPSSAIVRCASWWPIARCSALTASGRGRSERRGRRRRPEARGAACTCDARDVGERIRMRVRIRHTSVRSLLASAGGGDAGVTGGA